MQVTNTSERPFLYLTTTEVGDRVGKTGRIIQKYCEQGLLPYVRLGSGKKGFGLYLIHEEDFSRWQALLKDSGPR